jgi:hypothetical protein
MRFGALVRDAAEKISARLGAPPPPRGDLHGARPSGDGATIVE